MRVLFVEDQVAVRAAVRRAVGSFARDLVWDEADNLRDALAKLDPAPDCLLLDLALAPPPNADGLHVLLEARARNIWVPAVILSGELDAWSTAEGRDLGAVVFPKGATEAREIAARLMAGEAGDEHGRIIAERLQHAGGGHPSDAFARIAEQLAHAGGTLREQLDAIEAASVRRAIGEQGSKAGAARALGVGRSWLQRHFKD